TAVPRGTLQAPATSPVGHRLPRGGFEPPSPAGWCPDLTSGPQRAGASFSAPALAVPRPGPVLVVAVVEVHLDGRAVLEADGAAQIDPLVADAAVLVFVLVVGRVGGRVGQIDHFIPGGVKRLAHRWISFFEVRRASPQASAKTR